jgi:Predicted transcriptional regulator containing an HTH domain and an uncharacterized domain shared with the mammalian protein Schlafen
MTPEELIDKLNEIQVNKCESKVIEIKAANQGCPKRLFDTLSSFSNQDDGGVIIFGVDEENDYYECGVYDPQDIQKKINEQCLQMDPIVRPLLTVAEKEGKYFVSAEIPGIDISERPCFYSGKGRLKGSYVRIGDSDEPMTEYEIYSFEAFRKKFQDDIRPVSRATFSILDTGLLGDYIQRIKADKVNLSALEDEKIYELMSITRNGEVTLSSVFLFCKYPQAFFPQLSIIALRIAGESGASYDETGERFIDNKRIEGNIPEMLDQAIEFVKKNMREKTIINPSTGKRDDHTEYPITAIREAVLNTLVHRDYSIYTENKPIQITMYNDRIEIQNPGGIYGRIRVDQLGKIQPDTRNPVLATALETLRITENRYSGIPAIRRSMEAWGLKDPVFSDERGSFKVTLYNDYGTLEYKEDERVASKIEQLLIFLNEPRSRKEIADYLGLSTTSYAMQTYIQPLLDRGKVRMTDPSNPRSHNQRYVRVKAVIAN